jgi:5-methylcytosine-specific restriction endonuclease McrA
VSPDHDQSQPGNGLRSERMDRYVRVRGQLGPLRCSVKRAYGDEASALYKPRKPLRTLTRPPLPWRQEARKSKGNFMRKVFVVDTNKQPIDPVHPGWARKLLSSGQAAVLRYYPFTIILKRAVEQLQVQPLRVKLDPGSKTTGIAIVNDASGEVVFAAELTHRGQHIKAALATRRSVRRNRRQRKTHYRKPRFKNRRIRRGWLPPSLESRIANVLTWTRRLMRWCPITSLSMELVKFDLQQMENPEIAGVEYQQGTLVGYELREYLLAKWNHQCTYCGVTNVPLQVEHLQPRARGGTNRASNLCLACEPCNSKKGTLDMREFLKDQPEMLAKLLAQAKAPLKDASVVNTTRWRLYDQLKALDLPIECGSGGLTKFNRTQRGLPKTHWLDAANIGKSTPAVLKVNRVMPLLISATGSGNRQMCGTDRYGFPSRHRQRYKYVKGFQTGDMVRAVMTRGKYQGIHMGRVLVRASGSFDIVTAKGRVQGISYRYCTAIHRKDGYRYQEGERHSSPAEKERGFLSPFL